MTDCTNNGPDAGKKEYALTLANLPKILRESWRDYSDATMVVRVPLCLGMILLASGGSRFSTYLAPYVGFLCVAVFLSFLAFLVLRYGIRIDEWGIAFQIGISILYGFLMLALTHLFFGFIAVTTVMFVVAMSIAGLMMLIRMK